MTDSYATSILRFALRRGTVSLGGMLSPAEAENLIREHTTLSPSEDCPIGEAHGRILREAIHADRDLPPFDRVTLDGYAVRASALADGLRSFRVGGIQAAGMKATELGAAPDCCIEIMTGAVLPIGADCVIPYESTRRGEGTMTIESDPKEFMAGHAIHRRASDQLAGDEMVPPGTRLSGREIAVAAACGFSNLKVATVPRIAVVATGDELVDVGNEVASHQVRRSNDYALRAALIGAGYPQVQRFHLRDTKEEVEDTLQRLLAEFDVLILSGGISKGKFDFLPEALAKLGVKKIFQGVAQRPGKPLWFGVSARQTPVFALPGNPVSTYTCLHRYVLPALEVGSGLVPSARRRVALSEPVNFRPNLACFLPVRLASGALGELIAHPQAVNTSGDFSSLVRTDGFIELPADHSEFPAGFVAPFFPWH